MNFDGTNVNFLIAFLAGLITFFASCLLPLVPTYLSYLSGIAFSKEIKRKEIFLNSFFFTIGFILVFVLLGATANATGTFFVQYRNIIQRIGGMFLVIMALFILEVIKPAFLFHEKKIHLPHRFEKYRKINSLLTGFTFGFAWSPCIGPVLGVILFWASQAKTLLAGTSLLFVYGIGLGIPFLIIGLFFEKLAPKISHAGKFGHRINILAGILILVTGLLLVFGKLDYISIKLLQFFDLRTLSV